jgi:hypothetical protein
MKKMEAGLQKILSKSQWNRYHQIELQAQAPMVFLRPEVAKDLGITQDQRDDIEGILQDNAPQGQRGPGGPGGPGGPDGREKVLKLVLGKLTSGQKAKWNDMVGEPFKLPAMGRPPRGGQGGPGGPGGDGPDDQGN